MGIFDWFKKKLPPKKTKDKIKKVENKIRKNCEGKREREILNELIEQHKKEEEEKEEKVKFTIWCDDSPILVLSKKYMDRLEEAGIDYVSFMVNKANVRKNLPPWELKWRLAQLEMAAGMLRDRGIGVGVTKWPQPNREQMRLMKEGMKDVISAMDPDEIEDDTESNWTSKFLQGKMEDRAKELYEDNLELAEYKREGKRREIVVTSFPGHREMRPKTAKYSPLCDKTRNQLYGVRHRRNKGKDIPIPWDHKRLGPGGIQDYYLPNSKKLGPEVGCGLPGYDLEWPGHTKEEAFMKQFETARKFGVRDFGVWSSKWIFGKFAQEELFKTIKKIKKEK